VEPSEVNVDVRDELTIRPLKCSHCGAELPVMGQLVTFRCPSCFNYWVLAKDGIEPIFVYRAVPPDADGQADARNELMLPFWVAEIDGADLRQQVDAAVRELKETTQKILTTEIQTDEPSEPILTIAGRRSDLPDPGLARAHFLAEASGVKKLPSSSEINYLASRLESMGNLKIYVPAFRSPNTYAYLKVGRLLTRLQPACRLVRSDGDGRPILCALQADEAIALIDFIFFATLPDSIQSNGDLLEKIRLRPAKPPRLVEFPFRPRGASLVSIIGGFWISGRLVEQVGSLVE
jgi:hypothetical protein